MTKKENEDLIRRPKKRHLDLAKQLNIIPAEAMDLEEHHPATLKGIEALIDAAAQIQAGKIPPGVIVTYPKCRRCLGRGHLLVGTMEDRQTCPKCEGTKRG